MPLTTNETADSVARDILESLASAGVTVRLNGDHLALTLPSASARPAVESLVIPHKAELVAYLQGTGGTGKTPCVDGLEGPEIWESSLQATGKTGETPDPALDPYAESERAALAGDPEPTPGEWAEILAQLRFRADADGVLRTPRHDLFNKLADAGLDGGPTP